jgi:hypothetical protein
MAKHPKQTTPRRQDQVHIRSNVCIDPEARQFIPGDVLKRSGYYGPMNREQYEEAMYYAPCSLCRRTVFQIHEDGCDHPTCRSQPGILSTAEAIARKRRYGG